MPKAIRLHHLLCGIAAFGAIGCGEGPRDDLPREPISGKVTFEGKPVKSGTIQFIPTQTGDGPTSAAAAEIVGGVFSIIRSGGPVPGNYKVIISSATIPDVVPAGEPPGSTSPLAPEMLPAQYNRKSTLTAEVKAGGPNTFPFDLKK